MASLVATLGGGLSEVVVGGVVVVVSGVVVVVVWLFGFGIVSWSCGFRDGQ